ncbi:MAG TPA: PKD domain-containing protein [Bacteroidales bacterium]|nr:PKD domain-containing protein [Bacteroidales bacterium]
MKTQVLKTRFRSALAALLFLYPVWCGAVVYHMCSTALGTPGSIDKILAQAITDANGIQAISILDLPRNPVSGNQNIDPPQLFNAVFGGSFLHVVYKLNGSQHINANADFIVEFFKSNTNGDLLNYIGNHTITSLTGGFYATDLTIPPGVIFGPGDRLAATVTGLGNHVNPPNPVGTSEAAYIVTAGCASCVALGFEIPATICTGTSLAFTNTSASCFGNPSFIWDFGDGSPISATGTHSYTLPGTYQVKLSISNFWECGTQSVTKSISVTNCNFPCIDCIGSFAPDTGDYVLSAWVKEDINNPNILTYNNPQLFIDFPATNNSAGPFTSPFAGPFTATGSIIDGWQRVEAVFTVLPSATYINIRLQCATGNCFFDDIRIFPFDGSMKSYVYDPINLRLVAELDERNYATLYEYDEEGKLIRVKKETEKGIMTIQENKNNSPKQ